MTNIKIEFLLNKTSQYFETMKSYRETIRVRGRNLFLYSNLIFNLTAAGRQQRKCIDFLHSFTNKIIQQQTYALNELKNKSQNETNHKTLLETLIEAFYEKKLSQEMIHDNMITMLIAGTDTSAITVNFVVLMLANFPTIQEKAYKELWKIYGTKSPQSTPIKYEDLQYMDYLDRVIKETLRIFPTVPLFSRQLTEDLKMGEVILPKKANIVIDILTVHRNEKYWPNPLIFNPDRFLPEKTGTSYSNYYMPFSMGPRNCIVFAGMKYAMISIKVILATLIRTFVFKIDKNIQIDKIKLNVDITLSTIEPIIVKIDKRDLHYM
ncbi:cytochrome P450 4C1-like [Anoplolepis gracilipes]|uniref:cytochrome P450 4C1-like n=1 Tax=Anoplolepis gracilipes TaxID=354296 RepID=UPI003BA35308